MESRQHKASSVFSCLPCVDPLLMAKQRSNRSRQNTESNAPWRLKIQLEPPARAYSTVSDWPDDRWSPTSTSDKICEVENKRQQRVRCVYLTRMWRVDETVEARQIRDMKKKLLRSEERRQYSLAFYSARNKVQDIGKTGSRDLGLT